MGKITSVFFGMLLALVLIVTAISVTLIGIYSSDYGLLRVPFASWYVLGVEGLLLVLAGCAYYFWRRLRRGERDLAALRGNPLVEELPAIYGHRHLARAEFVPLIQALLRLPGIAGVHVKPLPGGYSGSTTVLAEPQSRVDAPGLPRAFVIKLGNAREMADEHDKFQTYVSQVLTQAAKFFRYAVWGEWAGVAYEFVGLESDNEIQSFYQFYWGHTAVELAEVIGEIYHPLDRAWYQRGQVERVDLYQAYWLLNRKREQIIGHLGQIVQEEDPYRVNFTVIKERLRPNLKPDFFPDLDLPWYDPVAFLRMWSTQHLQVPVHRSTVHGDLNARNVLIEVARDGRERVWFIDFSHTGNGLSGERTRQAVREDLLIDVHNGHTLRDFCRLEADVKFILTRLLDQEDLKLAGEFERALIAGGLVVDDWAGGVPPVAALRDERFHKAWQVIREIRRRAAVYVVNVDDLRPYYLSLLHATLSVVCYHQAQFEDEACERQQKRYALLAAGMLCSQL